MTVIVSILTVMNNQKTFSLTQLAALVDVPGRTIRFYIQSGLLAKPLGAGRGAHYDSTHVEQLLRIKKYSEAGLSLERIGELLSGEAETELPPMKGRKPGDIEVWSRIHIGDGLEINLEPSRAGLSPQQIREFSQQVMALYMQITQPEINKEK